MWERVPTADVEVGKGGMADLWGLGMTIKTRTLHAGL